MIRAHAIAGVTLAMAIAACGPSSDPELRASLPPMTPQPSVVQDVCELIAEPERFDRKTVRVKGALLRTMEAPLLGGTGCAHLRPVCVALDEMTASAVDESKLWSKLRTGLGAEVVVRGTFRSSANCDYVKQLRLDVLTLESVSERSILAWPPK